MLIANFRDYTNVLRSIYSSEAMGEIFGYYQNIMGSGAALKKQKIEVQREIYNVKQQILRLAEEIRLSADKKTIGIKLNKLKKEKQLLVNSLKRQQNQDHFKALNDEGKVCVCSSFLLQKFLTRELLENNPLQFGFDERGNLFVDIEKFRTSDLLQEAIHIKDFVAVFVTNNPDKVKTPGYFKTLLNGVSDWQGLLNYANKYFDSLNNNEFMEAGPIKASRVGAEVIMEFPDKKLQLVRLHTPKALDYESEKLQHCVGKGGYDKAIINGKTMIYSLRDLSEDGEWCPHVTIEYKGGTFVQIKGYKNKQPSHDLANVMRQALAVICHSDNFAEKINSDMLWLGFVKDVHGNICDLNNLTEKVDVDELHYNSELMKRIGSPNINSIGRFVFSGNWTDEVSDFVAQVKKIDKIDIRDITDGCLKARKCVIDLFGKEYIDSSRFSGNVNLGFIRPVTASIFHIDFDPLDAVRYIDIYSPRSKAEHVMSIKLNEDNMKLIEPNYLHVDTLEVKDNLKDDIIQKCAEFDCIGNLCFNNTDFKGYNVLDLQNIKNFAGGYEKISDLRADANCLILDTGGVAKTISRFVLGHTVSFSECKNMPDFASIVFPKDIHNIHVGESVESLKISDICLDEYRELELLQLNDSDLTNTKNILLPDSCKYLGLSCCKLGEYDCFDLNKYPNLEEVRLTASDLTKVKSIIFPKRLKRIFCEATQFSKDAVLDFRQCKDLDNICIEDSMLQERCDLNHILLPKNIQNLRFSYGNFDDVEEIDLTMYPNIKKVVFGNSSFPKLKRLVVPECELDIEQLKIPAETKFEVVKNKKQAISQIVVALLANKIQI